MTDSHRPILPPDRALEVGKAAEHLVCADLILQGHRAYLSDQGLPYDVIVDHGGKLLRIQVKATTSPKPIPQINHTPKYIWHVRRVGKNGKRSVGNDEFDVLALVATDILKIAYLTFGAKIPQCINMRPPGVPRGFTAARQAQFMKCIDEYPFDDVIADISK